MLLLELVYEGGEVLDLCLEAQRTILRDKLRDTQFLSVDLRGCTAKQRGELLRAASKATPANVLIRGLSGVAEASQVFLRAHLFLDALGKYEMPEPRELSPWAFRTKRVFVYSTEMDAAIRRAGVGCITKLTGPYFPRLDFDPIERVTYGVVALGTGGLEAVGRLKKMRTERQLSFDIATTFAVPGTLQAGSALEVAERSSIIVAPYEQADNGGPHEAAILALCAGRALCTSMTSALEGMPYPTDRFVLATRYSPGSYANAAVIYPQRRAIFDAWPYQVKLAPPSAVPDEVFRRIL